MKLLSCLFALCTVGLVGCGDDDGRGRSDAGPCPVGTICFEDSGPGPADTGPREDTGRRPDTGVGPGTCTVGTACNPDRGCVRGECIPANVTEIGGAADPIYDLPTPPGGDSIPATFWRDGYCVPALPTMAMLEACDPNDPMACPSCSSCTAVGGGQTICMSDCTLNSTTNGGCRMGYECQFGDGVCSPGCDSNEYCRLYREDTNMDGEVSNEGMPPADHLRYDTASMATCSM